ncbi:MAG: hypothetical protein JAZ14_06920 [Candidatus Thiodiazotropha endolucinida]|nr:hypothetical protein [Candidatus Thiodiazotropha taylori]
MLTYFAKQAAQWLQD